MILRFHFSLLVAAVALSLNGCSPDISGRYDRPAEKGSADFSTFVAIGDSLTAGYADGALYPHGQENSFPAILAQQFALAGGGAFTQPLMPMDATGSLTLPGPMGPVDLGRDDRLMLTATNDPDRPASPAAIVPAISSDVDTAAIPGLYNNLGVPGAKIFHAPAAGYGNSAGLALMPPLANPYFVRFASSPAASMLSDATDQKPSFFTLWLGNNDLLLYATDGADATVSGESVTPIGTMTTSFDMLLAGLKTANNKGVVINVPDLTTIPYFTTVPYDAIPLEAADIANLTPLAMGFNAVLDGVFPPGSPEAAQRRLSFSVGQNPVLINDETLTDLSAFLPVAPHPASVLAFARPATDKDYIVLPASKKIGVDSGGLYGISVPLVDADVLTEVEVRDEIETVRNPFNDYVEAAANADPDLLFFDAEAKLRELNDTGNLYGSGGITSVFGTGGGFSLDGVHPTARGYAVISNEIFKVINEGFDAYIPPVDPGEYTTVFYQ